MQPLREDGDELKALLPDLKLGELPNSHNSLMGGKGSTPKKPGEPANWPTWLCVFSLSTVEFVYVFLLNH